MKCVESMNTLLGERKRSYEKNQVVHGVITSATLLGLRFYVRHWLNETLLRLFRNSEVQAMKDN